MPNRAFSDKHSKRNGVSFWISAHHCSKRNPASFNREKSIDLSWLESIIQCPICRNNFQLLSIRNIRLNSSTSINSNRVIISIVHKCFDHYFYLSFREPLVVPCCKHQCIEVKQYWTRKQLEWATAWWLKVLLPWVQISVLFRNDFWIKAWCWYLLGILFVLNQVQKF